MQGKDIIITGLQSWDIQIGSNCKNIASEFAKQNRVLYVNPSIDRLTWLKEKEKRILYRRSKNLRIKEVEKNLWVYYPPTIFESINQLPNNYLFDKLNKINNKRFAGDIRKALDYLGFSSYIHFCDSDIFRSFYLKDLLQPEAYIYYSRDNLLAVKYWQTQGIRIEPAHMAKADIVTANSTYLANIAGKYNPNSVFVGQGCDLTAFNPFMQHAVPGDMKYISHPVVGYIGALKSLRLDIEIIESVAKARKDWSIVLVGPEDEDFKKSELHKLSNVYFLGSKDESELASYLSAFDVAINPQKVSPVTIGNYPRKIDEYLAMGKPTVAAKTDAMSYFDKVVALSENIDEWIKAVDNELRTNTTFKENERIAFAQSHTWKNSVDKIYRSVEEFLSTK